MLVVAARAQSRGGRVESYSLPPDQLQRAIEYARARHTLYFVGTAWGFVILGLVLALHLAPRYRTWAESATRKRIFQAYLFAPLLLLTIDLLELPVSMYGHRLAVSENVAVLRGHLDGLQPQPKLEVGNESFADKRRAGFLDAPLQKRYCS